MRYLVGLNVFAADSAADLVRQLHKTSMAPAKSDEEWMIDAARRARQISADWPRLRSSSPEEFIADLIEAGYIRQLS